MKKKLLKFILILVSATAFLSTSAVAQIQDRNQLRIPDSTVVQIITLLDKSQITGRISSVGSDEIMFEGLMGTLAVPILKIKSIKEIPASKFVHGEFWFPDLKNVSYPEVGVIFGSVTGLTGGYWMGAVGLYASGLWLTPNLYGGQFNLGYKISDNLNRTHSVALVGGIWYIKTRKESQPDDSYKYIGLLYTFNYKRFFVETGPTFGQGDSHSTLFLIQVGYKFRFIPTPKGR